MSCYCSTTDRDVVVLRLCILSPVHVVCRHMAECSSAGRDCYVSIEDMYMLLRMY